MKELYTLNEVYDINVRQVNRAVKEHLPPAFSTAITILYTLLDSSFIVKHIRISFSTMYLRNEFAVKHKGVLRFYSEERLII